MFEFYEQTKKEVDSFISPIIKKHLKRAVRERMESKNLGGTVMDDWDQLKKGYTSALVEIIAHHESQMQLAGVIQHSGYVPPEEI